MGDDKTDAFNQLCTGVQPLKNRQKVNCAEYVSLRNPVS